VWIICECSSIRAGDECNTHNKFAFHYSVWYHYVRTYTTVKVNNWYLIENNRKLYRIAGYVRNFVPLSSVSVG
jgi:hypothetical protein